MFSQSRLFIIAYNIYMVYFILPILVVAYLECFGQTILWRLKKEIPIFSFGIGVIVWLATAYISTGILTASNSKFHIILTIYILFFLFSIILIFKYKTRPWRFEWKYWLVLVGFVGMLSYFSYHTTLGDPNGFDTLHYLNFVSSNVGINRLNSTSILYGNQNLDIALQYRFQSYYYLASSLLYVVQWVTEIVQISFYIMIGYVWTFQILYFSLTGALLIIALEKMPRHQNIVMIVVFMMYLLFLEKLYFNNVFGFYGNTHRTMLIGYSCYFLYLYFQKHYSSDKWLCYLSLIAGCAVSSSATFIMAFFLLSFFFAQKELEPNILKEFAIILLLPVINIFSVYFNNIQKGCLFGILFCTILFGLNRTITNAFQKRKTRFYLLIMVAVLVFLSSLLITRNPFDLSSFHSTNETADMTIDYFQIANNYPIKIFYTALSLIILGISIFNNLDFELIYIDFVLILLFFNPLCSPFIHRIIFVYYRGYDIIFNPFTHVLLLTLFFERFSSKQFRYVLTGLLSIGFLLLFNPLQPLFYHESFIPGEDYSGLYRMDKKAFETISTLKNHILYTHLEEPKIVTPVKYTQSMLNKGNYYFNRGNLRGPWSEAEYEIYLIFHPDRYLESETKIREADYSNVCKYIKEAEIDYIVVRKEDLYYDENFEGGTWLNGNYYVSNCGTYPFYENEQYSVYYYEK